jgi:ketosteroid isomerase-like protein
MQHEAELARLIDEAAIKDVHLRYCRGIDRMDWEMVRSCYHPDAIDDHGPFRGGIDAFIEWVQELLPKYQSTTHFSGNQLVEIEGDSAWAEHYARAYHRTAATDDAPATDWILNLRYVDRMERRDGEWRIAHRVLACESERTVVITGDAELGEAWHRGTRDRSDASYDAAFTVGS